MNAAERDLVAPPRRASRSSGRAHDGRNISLQDLNQLRLWMETKPDVGLWYKDFDSFKLGGEGKYPRYFFSLVNWLWTRALECTERSLVAKGEVWTGLACLKA